MNTTTIFKNLNFEQLYQGANELTLSRNDSYIKSYPEFINYFKGIDNITEHNLVIASHFVYGWMPTIINLNIHDKKLVLELLNKVKNDEVLTKEQLEELKKVINNSMVGLSKLLHFINPKYYVIWDSRIYRYLTDRKSQYGIGDASKYIQYIEGIKNIKSHPNYKSIHNLVVEKLGYDAEPTRIIELIMFQADINKQQLAKRVPIKGSSPDKVSIESL